jgi:hypothetical protein
MWLGEIRTIPSPGSSCPGLTKDPDGDTPVGRAPEFRSVEDPDIAIKENQGIHVPEIVVNVLRQRMTGVYWIARSLHRLVLSILGGEAEEQIFDDARRSDLPAVADGLGESASRIANAPSP